MNRTQTSTREQTSTRRAPAAAKRGGPCLIAVLLGLLSPALAAQSAEYVEVFERLRPGLFTVEVVDRASGNKNAQGSGFLVGRDGRIATNYHVVSEHVLDPEHYALRFRGLDDAHGALEVLALDVLHDLALVQIAPEALPKTLPEPFAIAEAPPREGAAVLALGNPYDIGISVVPGTYNGLLGSQYRQLIHFTGALNPGMSGGPAVDTEGRVVGINVAGAGNSVSFLVPADRLAALIAAAPERPLGPERLRDGLAAALIEHQDGMIQALIEGDWTLEPFGPLLIPRAIRPWISCSGNSSASERELPWRSSHSDCTLNDRIYLSRSLDTGPLEMIFNWYRSDQLNPLQFSQMFQQTSFLPFNRTGDDDVTPFACREDWVAIEALAPVPFKVSHCLRAYLDYPGLYDVLFIARAQRDGPEGVHLHYTLAGVGRDTAAAFHRKFIRSLRWK